MCACVHASMHGCTLYAHMQYVLHSAIFIQPKIKFIAQQLACFDEGVQVCFSKKIHEIGAKLVVFVGDLYSPLR